MPRNRPSATSFLDETTVHGVREAWRNKNPYIRVFWSVILLSCFCGLTYEIYRIVIYYRSNPSASQVKWVIKDSYEYPPMIFCPKTFLSMEKVKRLNMSQSALAYAVALFQIVHEVPSDFDLDKAKTEVKNIMRRKKFRTYMQLFEALSFDGSDIMREGQTRKPIKLEAYVPSYGMCYRLHLPPVKATTLKSNNILELEHFPFENTTQYDFIHDATLVVRDTTGVKADMILLSKRAFYQIDFQVQLHKRLSNRGMECLGPDEISENYYVADCEFSCLSKEKYKSGCTDCLPFQLLNEANSTTEPCTSFEVRKEGRKFVDPVKF